MRQPWRTRAGGALIAGLLLFAPAVTTFKVKAARDAAPASPIGTSDQVVALARLSTALVDHPGGADRAGLLATRNRASRDEPIVLPAPVAPAAPPEAAPAPGPEAAPSRTRASASTFGAAAPPVAVAPPAAVVAEGGRVWPAQGQITSGFGGGRNHPGIDIDGETGDPVVASAAGAIRIAGPAPRGYSGYGIVVLIDHGDGVETLYAHLSRVAVRPGQLIGAGMRVGSLGSTGQSTGSHLHFEVRRGGRTTNPMAWLRGAAR